MASPSPYTKRRRPSKGGFFYKSILLALFLLALPLFPSQAPEFVGETMLTKLWELIHLLIVGIAVAYGLFSRRSVETSVDTRTSCVDESSLSYVSSFFHVSSVFDEDSCDLRSDSLVVVNESKHESFSQVCLQERSKVVVVARPGYGLDGYVVHQPLGLPVRSLRSALEDSSCDDKVVAAPPSPHGSLELRSSSSSLGTSFESHTQNRFSPSRSVSDVSNVDESVKEKSLESSSSPSLPPSPPLVADDTTHRLVLHSRRYSDGSLLEEGLEDELEGSEVRGRRTEVFSKKEVRSKSLKLAAESSKRKSKSRRSYRTDADDSTTRRRDLQHKSDDNIKKGVEHDRNKVRVKKGRSHESLELTAEASSLTIPAVDPRSVVKASRRGSSDTLLVKDIKRNSEDELPGDNKVLKLNSLRREPQQSCRASSKVSSRGKSVRTIRSDLKTDRPSSEDQAARTKPRRQWQEELAIVLHQEETHTKSDPEDDDDVTEETKVEQLQLTLEEEAAAAAAWESQSNASHDHHEVDRKADEFIAKFREQIRLQKLHSGEQPRGGGGTGNGIVRNSHFR